MASIRSERPVPMVSTTTSHIRPQVTSRTRSNAAAEPSSPTPTTATASPGLTPPAYTDEPQPVDDGVCLA
jgi:hypothetical protein